jgi:hypothetical protein
LIVPDGIAAVTAGTVAVTSAMVAKRVSGLGRAFAAYMALCAGAELGSLVIMQSVYHDLPGGAVGAFLMFSTWGLWMTAHLPSIAVLGVDEIVERHGVFISTAAHFADLLLWACCMTLVYRLVERAGRWNERAA